LKDLGEDPVTKRHVVVRSGRFGLYVTDGEVNATLRLGDTPETLTLDRASELLAERRNAEPSTRVAKRPAKKATAKKATVKKTAKKAGATKKETGAAKRAATTKGARANAALAAATSRTKRA
jgi:DNA topoisomerase-1